MDRATIFIDDGVGYRASLENVKRIRQKADATVYHPIGESDYKSIVARPSDSEALFENGSREPIDIKCVREWDSIMEVYLHVISGDGLASTGARPSSHTRLALTGGLSASVRVSPIEKHSFRVGSVVIEPEWTGSRWTWHILDDGQSEYTEELNSSSAVSSSLKRDSVLVLGFDSVEEKQFEVFKQDEPNLEI